MYKLTMCCYKVIKEEKVIKGLCYSQSVLWKYINCLNLFNQFKEATLLGILFYHSFAMQSSLLCNIVLLVFWYDEWINKILLKIGAFP